MSPEASPEKGFIYIVDMESSLAEPLVRRVMDMGQYHVFRKWDMPVDPEAEVDLYGNTLSGIILSGSAKNVNSPKYAPPNIQA